MSAITDFLQDMFNEVSPRDFYRGIFPAGELDKAGAFTPGKYTGIIVAVSSKKKWNGQHKVYRYSLTDDLEAVDTAVASDDFCLCSPLSYAGKKRTAENARMLYAIAVDVDRIKQNRDGRSGWPAGMRDLWHQVTTPKYLPRPTYIVSSGTGIHLYYVLEQPLPLYPDIAFELQELKRELTRKIWNGYIVDIDSEKDIQQEGIYQGFRMPGTVTKNGGRAVAYKTGERVTVEYLNSFVEGLYKAKKAEEHRRRRVKLEAAAEKWPEWYEKHIIRGEKGGQWNISRNLYDWWKEQIKNGATVGHRYYCLMMLAIYAQKCSHYDAKHNPQPVTREELERDCFALMDGLEALTDDEKNHFGADDVLAALEAFDERWTRYPRQSIEYKSGITIPANKRNGRKQETHLKIARNTLAILSEEKGINLQGRKSAKNIITSWRQQHKNGTIKECIAETGIKKTTVYKYWKVDSLQQPAGISSASSRAAEAAAEAKQRQREREELAEQMKKAEEMLAEYERKYSEIEAAAAERDIAAEMRRQLEVLKGLSERLDETERNIDSGGGDQGGQ